jgi:hypothetical protein
MPRQFHAAATNLVERARVEAAFTPSAAPHARPRECARPPKAPAEKPRTIEAGQVYTADRHRPVTTEHGRLLKRRLVAPHFDNAFLCVHLQGAIVSCG